MAQVLIVEPDEDVCASLRTLMQMAGHDTADSTTTSGGLAYLSTSSVPVVVLCGNDSPAHLEIVSFFTRIATEVALARRHGYICLTTDPGRLPPQLLALLDQLAVPVMRKPFSIEPLLALVDDMAARIAHKTITTRTV
jgi:DNA-binding response OmpR family regulator